MAVDLSSDAFTNELLISLFGRFVSGSIALSNFIGCIFWP